MAGAIIRQCTWLLAGRSVPHSHVALISQSESERSDHISSPATSPT